MVELLFIFSLLLLVASWILWFEDRAGRKFATWRKFPAWIALLTLSGSVLSFARLLLLVRRADYSFNNDLVLILSIIRTGFLLAIPPLFLCWFATPKVAACLGLSTVVILLLWVASAMWI